MLVSQYLTINVLLQHAALLVGHVFFGLTVLSNSTITVSIMMTSSDVVQLV